MFARPLPNRYRSAISGGAAERASLSCRAATEEERMAGARRNDLLGRLADLGEEAIQRLQDTPGADRAVGAVTTLRDRLDELQKRVRGLEDLERRLAAVERKLEKATKSGSSSSTTRRSAKATSTKSSGGATAKKS